MLLIHLAAAWVVGIVFATFVRLPSALWVWLLLLTGLFSVALTICVASCVLSPYNVVNKIAFRRQVHLDLPPTTQQARLALSMTQQTNLSAEFEELSKLIDKQPESVREPFHYALAVLLIENRTATVVDTFSRDNREYITVRTNSGDIFTVVRPSLSPGRLDYFTAMVREIIDEEKGR